MKEEVKAMKKEIVLASRGISRVYVRITKSLARKMFEAGYYVNVQGSKQRRCQDNFIPITTDENGMAFDKWVNAYEYYNRTYYGNAIYFVCEYDFREFHKFKKEYDY